MEVMTTHEFWYFNTVNSWKSLIKISNYIQNYMNANDMKSHITTHKNGHSKQQYAQMIKFQWFHKNTFS